MHINRINASRIAATYGYEKKTEDECMKLLLADSPWCNADSGSLLRIADALERIALLLDPEERRRLQLEKAQQQKDKARRLRRDGRMEKNMQRLRPFLLRAFDSISHLSTTWTEKNRNMTTALQNAVRSEVNRFSRYPWHWNHSRKILRMAIEHPEVLHTVHLYGIGPVKSALWAKLERREVVK